MPTRVRTPRHKGKVERGVDYVQENALRGHEFETLAAQNEHLTHWERTVADTRIHGTTCKQVRGDFEAIERPAFHSFSITRRSVAAIHSRTVAEINSLSDLR